MQIFIETWCISTILWASIFAIAIEKSEVRMPDVKFAYISINERVINHTIYVYTRVPYGLVILRTICERRAISASKSPDWQLNLFWMPYFIVETLGGRAQLGPQDNIDCSWADRYTFYECIERSRLIFLLTRARTRHCIDNTQICVLRVLRVRPCQSAASFLAIAIKVITSLRCNLELKKSTGTGTAVSAER